MSAPPSVRVLDFDGLRLVTDASGSGMLGRTVFVSEGDASLGDIGVHPRGDGLRVRILRVAHYELSPGVSNPLTHKNSFLSVNEFLFDVTGSLSKTVHDTLLEIPSCLPRLSNSSFDDRCV